MDRATGNQDEQEKNRKLSEAEQKRLEAFEAAAKEWTDKGYSRKELTVSIVKANVFAVVLLIPLFVIGFGLMIILNKPLGFTFGIKGLVLFFVIFAVLIVVHELIHGVSWAIITEHHFKDVSLGFMKQYLTPYCACSVPLTKGQYIFGALMPLVLLGIVPMIVGIAAGSMFVMLMGIVMADAAAGDIMIVWNILKYKTQAKEVVYMDHPTQAGGVIFER